MMDKRYLHGVEIVISPDVLCQELDGEMVILDMKSGQYFGIDTIGCEIWKMLEKNVCPDEIVDHLLNEYDVLPDTCCQHVYSFIDHLQQSNLISLLPGKID